jgi:hypothetical protein
MQATDYSKIKITRVRQGELAAALHSWRTVYRAIKDLDDSDESLHYLADMLACEVRNPDGPRLQIMTRLHMRINAMRQRLEYNSVLETATR